MERAVAAAMATTVQKEQSYFALGYLVMTPGVAALGIAVPTDRSSY
jgi:hypothetical protein